MVSHLKIMARVLHVIRVAEVPIFLAVFFVLFLFLYNFFDLPPVDELLPTLRRWYHLYGWPLVFVAALVEGIFMINFYFPGSFVIILSVIAAEKSILVLGKNAVVVWLGFICAMVLNYFIGRTGFYRLLTQLDRKDLLERARIWATKTGRFAPWIAAVHPNFLALVVVNLGIGRTKFSDAIMVSAGATALWVVVWTAIVALFFREELVESPYQHWFVLGFFAIWAIVLIIKDKIGRRRAQNIGDLGLRP